MLSGPGATNRELDIAIVGFGRWGEKLAQRCRRLPGCRVGVIADIAAERRRAARALFPEAVVCDDHNAVFDSDADVVVLCSAPVLHERHVASGLTAGKHVLASKLVATSRAACRDLVELAARNDRILMADFTYIYDPSIRFLKRLLQNGRLGTLQYVRSFRRNYGTVRDDVDVIWDLAPHDFAIQRFLLGSDPLAVTAHTWAPRSAGTEGTAHAALLTARFLDGVVWDAEVSWVGAAKERRIELVFDSHIVRQDHVLGTQQILKRGFGDAQDRVVDVTPVHDPDQARRAESARLRDPLARMCAAFVEAARTGTLAVTSGDFLVSVTASLEAASRAALAARTLTPTAVETFENVLDRPA